MPLYFPCHRGYTVVISPTAKESRDMPKSYTDAKCPHCGKDLFSSTPPWEAKKGQKIVVDTCMMHGKVA